MSRCATYLGLRAMRSAAAEQSEQASITFHPDLVAASTDPLIRQQMQNQERFSLTRRSLLRWTAVDRGEESIPGPEGAVGGLQRMLENRTSQLKPPQ